ncbi:MAG: hypothetical protein JNM95_02540 [Chitinophagaceae bacterium]|nr:hypothetical protein [Chitinophagaceae bacterium]
MAKKKPIDIQLLNKFNAYIDLLEVNGYTISKIAESLSIFKTNKEEHKQEIDFPAFKHIRNGERKIFKENTVEDFINVLEAHREYRKVLMPKSIDAESYAHTFLWYYWSHKECIGVAFIGINRTATENQLIQGTLHYLTKDSNGYFAIRKSRIVKSFTHIPHRSLEFTISKHQHSPCTYIIADLGGESIETISISYSSFCGSSSAVQGVYSGISILEYIDPRFVEQRIKEISQSIPASILNALYYRRHIKGEFEPGSHMSIQDLRKGQLKFISNIKGYWLGTYIRGHIREGKIKGGIAKVLMHIDESGYIQVFVKSDYGKNPISPFYTGMFYFPDGEKEGFMIGKLNPTKGVHRIRLHLKLHSDGLTGIMAGWRKEDNDYFTRAVLLEPINQTSFEYSVESITKLIQEYQPKGYGRNHIGLFEREINKIQELELDYIHSFDNCFGRNGGVQLGLF